MQSIAQSPLALSPLDQALLDGIDAVITYYEPLVASMVKTRATQERATLNEADMKQHARLTVLRCYNAIERMPPVRSFDALVKNAVAKNLLTQVGKEFCKSRGRFLIEEFKESAGTNEESVATTPTFAQTAYDDYNEKMSQEPQLDLILSDIYSLVHPDYHPVFNALLTCDTPKDKFKNTTYKKLAASIGIDQFEFMAIEETIQICLRPFKKELFGDGVAI